MIEYSDEDGGDYEESDEVYVEDFDEDFDEDLDEEAPPLDVSLATFGESDDGARKATLQRLGTVAGLERSNWWVRMVALMTLGQLEPAALARYSHVVTTFLRDPVRGVRIQGLKTLATLEPGALAQHAHAVVALLDDSSVYVRLRALQTLARVEQATLAQDAHTVVAMLDAPFEYERLAAVQTLGKLEPATLAQYANAVLDLLEETEQLEVGENLTTISVMAARTLRGLPRFVTHDVDFHAPDLRSRLLGRLGWYKCRLIMRVRSHVIYWYALPYRPSGPGHARDVGAWNLMNVR